MKEFDQNFFFFNAYGFLFLKFILFIPASGFQFDYVFDWTILKYQQSQIAGGPSRAVVCPIPVHLWVIFLIFSNKVCCFTSLHLLMQSAWVMYEMLQSWFRFSFVFMLDPMLCWILLSSKQFFVDWTIFPVPFRVHLADQVLQQQQQELQEIGQREVRTHSGLPSLRIPFDVD